MSKEVALFTESNATLTEVERQATYVYYRGMYLRIKINTSVYHSSKTDYRDMDIYRHSTMQRTRYGRVLYRLYSHRDIHNPDIDRPEPGEVTKIFYADNVYRIDSK